MGGPDATREGAVLRAPVNICLYVCISQKQNLRLYEIVLTCYLWPCLSLSVMAMQYVE